MMFGHGRFASKTINDESSHQYVEPYGEKKINETNENVEKRKAATAEYAINIFMHGNYSVNRSISLHKAQHPLQ